MAWAKFQEKVGKEEWSCKEEESSRARVIGGGESSQQRQLS